MKTINSVILIAVLALPGSVAAQSDDVRKNNFNVSSQVAISGYDPVSYFSQSPKKGEKKLKYTYKGITYLFSDQNNLEKFKASPDKYEPSYGGWCAYAMGEKGEKVEVDPETFKVLEGKLYLFYNSWGNNTLTKWNKNENTLKAHADQNWKKIVP